MMILKLSCQWGVQSCDEIYFLMTKTVLESQCNLIKSRTGNKTLTNMCMVEGR